MVRTNERHVAEFTTMCNAEMMQVHGGAQVDYFLKIETIDGESTSAAGSGGGGAGKVSMRDFSFTMKVCK
jgi:hypothetical protein